MATGYIGVVQAHAVPSCPRCGYDQSGEIARWADTAVPPTPGGTRVECGLEFEWIDVLDSSRHTLPGFFEHTPGLVGFFTGAWRTWWWTILPWRFWSKVQMHHKVRPRRLAFWLIALWLLPLTCFVACRGIGRVWCDRVRTVPAFGGAAIYQPPKPAESMQYHALAIGAEMVWPILEAHSVHWTPIGNGGLLLRKQSPAIFHLFSFYGLPSGMYVALAASFMFPSVLLMLPVTRSEAKVNWRHLWRAAIYSLAWLGLGMIMLVPDIVEWLRSVIRVTKQPWPDDFVLLLGQRESQLPLVEMMLSASSSTYIALWLLLWWYIAIDRGFRFRRPFLVWLAAAVPTALAVVIARVLCFGFLL